MYIINDTYFQAAKREIPNLDEADSKEFAELERIIDEKCRLLFLDFLTAEQFQEFDSYLVNGLFPENAQPDPLLPDYVPQKWIDLVNGVTYQVNNFTLKWNGLIYSLGTSKQSLLADYVYSFWLESQVSYMTGVGDAKGQPKGAVLVNPTQRYVNTWNDFVIAYQSDMCGRFHLGWFDYGFVWNISEPYYNVFKSNEVSLMQFLSDKNEDYPNDNRKFFEVKNQLGL